VTDNEDSKYIGLTDITRRYLNIIVHGAVGVADTHMIGRQSPYITATLSGTGMIKRTKAAAAGGVAPVWDNSSSEDEDDSEEEDEGGRDDSEDEEKEDEGAASEEGVASAGSWSWDWGEGAKRRGSESKFERKGAGEGERSTSKGGNVNATTRRRPPLTNRLKFLLDPAELKSLLLLELWDDRALDPPLLMPTALHSALVVDDNLIGRLDPALILPQCGCQSVEPLWYSIDTGGFVKLSLFFTRYEPSHPLLEEQALGLSSFNSPVQPRFRKSNSGSSVEDGATAGAANTTGSSGNDPSMAPLVSSASSSSSSTDVTPRPPISPSTPMDERSMRQFLLSKERYQTWSLTIVVYRAEGLSVGNEDESSSTGATPEGNEDGDMGEDSDEDDGEGGGRGGIEEMPTRQQAPQQQPPQPRTSTVGLLTSVFMAPFQPQDPHVCASLLIAEGAGDDIAGMKYHAESGFTQTIPSDPASRIRRTSNARRNSKTATQRLLASACTDAVANSPVNPIWFEGVHRNHLCLYVPPSVKLQHLQQLTVRLEVRLEDREVGSLCLRGDEVGGVEDVRRRWYTLDSGGKLLCKVAWQTKYVESPNGRADRSHEYSYSR
jgi:hypothetical protein